VLDLFSSPLPATGGAHCRLTAAPGYIYHRRPNSAPPPFSRLPFRNRILRLAPRHIFSALTILSTPHPSENAVRPPFLFKVLLLCFPISSRTDFVVSQLPLLQSSVPMSWEHFVVLLPIAFNPLAVNGQKLLSLLLPEHSPLSHPQKQPLLTWGRLAACHPPDTSPPDQSKLHELSVAPATCDARASRRHLSPRRRPHHTYILSNAVYSLRRRS
jgi:hypothetical protein